MQTMDKLGRWYLAFVGSFAVIQGVSYIEPFRPDPLPGVLDLLTSLGIPVNVWAFLWLAVGVFALAGIFRVKIFWSCMALAGSVVWGLVYLLAFFKSLVVAHIEVNRDWVSARNYLWFVAMCVIFLVSYTIHRGQLTSHPRER